MTETSPTQVPPKVVMAPKVAQRLAVAVLAKPAAPEAKPAAPEAKVAPRPQATPPGAAPAPAKPSGVKLRTLNDHTANATSSQIKEVSTQLQELSNFDTPADLDASARADNLLPLVASTPSSPAPSSQAWIQALPDHRWLIEHTRQNTREAAALWAGSHPGLEHARLVVLPARDDQPRYALITGPFVDQAAARRYAGQIQNAIAPVFMLGADLKRQAATAP